MQPRFFEVTGQLVDAAGKPLQDVLLSVLDSDDYADDLIGVGTPNDDGRFCVSFTREAFNQDWFENEELPDLYIVVSKLDEKGEPTAFFQKDYPGRTFEGGKEELGQVVVTDDRPVTTAKGSFIYDFSKVRRVDVDEEVIAHVMEAVTQRVQAVTGWADVAKGVPVNQTYELLAVIQEITAGAIGKEKELPWWSELHQRVQKSVLGGIAAIYDPFKREVWLDHGLLGQAGLDIMKASMAHELVHAGQFDHYPDLVEAYRASLIAHDLRMRYGVRKDPAEPMPDELVQQLLPSFVFMCNLEGYARYVEKQFFARAHTCQRYVPQIRLGLIMGTAPVLSIANLTSETVHPPVIGADATAKEKATAWLTSLDPLAYKAEQYGCDQWYTARQKGDAPVPFSVTLGEELLEKVTEFAAKKWDEQEESSRGGAKAD